MSMNLSIGHIIFLRFTADRKENSIYQKRIACD